MYGQDFTLLSCDGENPNSVMMFFIFSINSLVYGRRGHNNLKFCGDVNKI
jgi:hypothetical protein